jgi:hypothetical protein
MWIDFMLLFKIERFDFIEIIKSYCLTKKIISERKIVNNVETKHLEEEFENYEQRFPCI